MTAHRTRPVAALFLRYPALVAVALAMAVLGCGAPADLAGTPAELPPELPSGWTAKQTQYAERDMVAAANPLAVDAGVAILAQGGSAVDAAIAVQMVLTLVEPQSSGIGGGAFLLHFDPAASRLIAYDGRETAPAAATPDMFLGPDGRPLPFTQAVDGGLSVGTPGVIRLFEDVHRAHGVLPWATLFAPAIALAEEGFAVSPRLHTMIAGTADRLCAQPAARDYFLKPNTCEALDEGTRVRNPELAATLRAIAGGGAAAFYTGTIAQAMVDAVRTHPTNPGRLSMADLAGYTSVAREPLCGTYRTFQLCGMPPPSSGTIAVLQTLGMLERFNVAAMAPGSADAVHLLSEAYRLAYADRAVYAADDGFVDVPVAGLLDAGYLASRAALIRMNRSLGVPKAGTPAGTVAGGRDQSLDLPSTSHVSIVDREGRMVNMTTTIENAFGSLQLVRGFLLNNELTDFSLVPTDEAGRPVANRVEPGKRPRSSMAPIVVFNAQGKVEALVGSPGGSAIIQYVTKTLVGLIDWRLDIQQAIDLPNFGAQTSATTMLERGTHLAGLQADLEARGHAVAVDDITSGLQGIVMNGTHLSGAAGAFARAPGRGRWAGGADPRREGTARGH